jgi:hypothetical protein
VLQAWTGRAHDDGHRLTGAKLAQILDLARPILPPHDLSVEVEHDEGGVSQFPVKSVAATARELVLHVAEKHAACLAPDKCGAGDNACESDAGETAATPAESACCGGGKTACCS